MPNSRSIPVRSRPRPRSRRGTPRVSTAAPHIGCSSRGGPGSTTTVGAGRRPAAARRGPAPCRPGSSTVAPRGTIACLRLAARTASMSRFGQRCGQRRAGSPRSRSSSASSSTISRPWNSPTTSRGQVVLGRSQAAAGDDQVHALRRRASAAPPACPPGRSPTITLCARSTPSSRSRSASHGPLRSTTRPVRTSVPVTTMPGARAHAQVGRWLGDSAAPALRRSIA